MSNLAEMAPSRNVLDGQSALPLCAYRLSIAPVSLTPGGREIHRRTGWSISLCNAIAAAWAFGSVEC